MKQILERLCMLVALVLSPMAAWAQISGPYPVPSALPDNTGSNTSNSYTYKSYQGTYGNYVTDHQEKALYIFSADTAGGGKSSCYAQCAQAWPPVIIPSDQTPQGSGDLKKEALGTIKRDDGSYQVTYYGWPLYYYASDQGTNPKGHKLNEYGGIWYLIQPDGKAVR